MVRVIPRARFATFPRNSPAMAGLRHGRTVHSRAFADEREFSIRYSYMNKLAREIKLGFARLRSVSLGSIRAEPSVTGHGSL